MKSILCLSGWGQNFDSIESSICTTILKKYQIRSLDYSSFPDFDYLCKSINSSLNPDVIIGWSLGGQIALRLIEKEIFNPKALLLIAPPFQLVKDKRVKAGMPPVKFEEFYNNFKKTPNLTLRRFAALSVINDKNKSEIVKNFKIHDRNQDNLLNWLEELKRFSFFDFTLNKIPQTQYIIGLGDSIVHPSQAKYFEEKISNININYFHDCGHAPHLNDNKRFNEILLKILTQI